MLIDTNIYLFNCRTSPLHASSDDVISCDQATRPVLPETPGPKFTLYHV